MSNPWVREAIAAINADFTRSADTHLVAVPLPSLPQIRLYIKDESTHITGSLKHRLARSLFLYALCNGWIQRDTPIIEASSGSTAISEAYYARLLGLRFIAVMSRSTSLEKIRRITSYGGECVLVDDPTQDRAKARELALELHGHFMDQFTFAERATDWRGNNNIAESIFKQLKDEPYPIPQWIICGAGTGGTAATLGRYIRYCSYETQVCVVDPEHSAYYTFYKNRGTCATATGGSGVEGIGRPQIEPSFLPEIIDHMISVPNVASYAAIHLLEELVGKRYGGSTGTNFYGACLLMADMVRHNVSGSLVMLGCDSGELYRDTYYNAQWLIDQGFEIEPYLEMMRRFIQSGFWKQDA
ncbi:PLP-dependent cysteine synthase family protein [Tengunoibacter tsumagoiensis]|uniref:L-cysteine desulfhydrase Cds1 n=1 Tax=Tengunoibacter tsumagoiensis TaxID=2014871 RepID=A0A402A9T9_9CHLR|nr:pyridoxal-phosphate dependent enzyme [Tengunoibacter tsumagoiensis]GCE15922.1 cysteine synthase [Tengunoibacter tsumagoiensis]